MICGSLTGYLLLTWIPFMLSFEISDFHIYRIYFYLLYTIDTIILLFAVYFGNRCGIMMYLITYTSFFTMISIACSDLERSKSIPIHYAITCVIIAVHLGMTLFTFFKSVMIRKVALSIMYVFYCLHLPLTMLLY